MLEYLNALKQEWPTVKAAPRSFIICFIVGIIIGGGAILFLYSYFVLPGKDAQISLLQTLTDGQNKIAQMQKQIPSRIYAPFLNPSVHRF